MVKQLEGGSESESESEGDVTTLNASTPQFFMGSSSSSLNSSGENASVPQSFMGSSPFYSSGENASVPQSFMGSSPFYSSGENSSVPQSFMGSSPFYSSGENSSVPQSFMGSSPSQPIKLKSIKITDEDDITDILLNANKMMYVNELTIKNCNDWEDDLVIENMPNLEKIIVKKNSLVNLNLIKICNCEYLKTIEVEDNAFEIVKNVIIESISRMYF